MSIINQTNNYLKKGAIILVIIMLIAIPNLDVYSSLGGYQTFSPAITANSTYYTHSRRKEDLYYLSLVTAVVSPVVGAVALVTILTNAVALLTAPAVIAGAGISFPKGGLLFTIKYHKYDFSKFDN